MLRLLVLGGLLSVVLVILSLNGIMPGLHPDVKPSNGKLSVVNGKLSVVVP
jgi:hypothetical protein